MPFHNTLSKPVNLYHITFSNFFLLYLLLCIFFVALCVMPQVAEPCPKCEYHELRFYTMQMRSVDEGQTVFYECEKCNHTYSTNT